MPLSRFIIIVAIVLLALLWPAHVEYEVNYSTGARRSVTYFAGVRLYARGMEPNAFEKVPVDSVALGLPDPKNNWHTYGRRYYAPLRLLFDPTCCGMAGSVAADMMSMGKLFEGISADAAVATKSVFLQILNEQGAGEARAYVRQWIDETYLRLVEEMRADSGR